jgi:hypothetical protein
LGCAPASVSFVEWWQFNPLSPESFEAFKYDQEKAKDLWAGVGAVLAALLALK